MSEQSNSVEQLSETSLSDEHERKIHIEVVYGTSTKQEILALQVDDGITVEQAIQASGMLDLFPEIDLAKSSVGIWNRVVKPSAEVHDLDRIEIYRPLLADPKEVRKRRAEKAKLEGRADKVTGGRVNPLRGKSSEE